MESTQFQPTSGQGRTAAPTSVLLLLGAVVLVLHGALAQWFATGQNTTAPSDTTIARPFITRAIASPAQALGSSTATAATTQKKAKAMAPTPSKMDSSVAQDTLVQPAAEELAPAQTEAPVEASAAPAIGELTPPVANETAALPEAAQMAGASGTAITVPGSLRLKYSITGEVRSFSYSARAELLWLHDGSTYDARLEVGAFLLGTRVQTSAGKITAGGLEPKRFSDKAKSEVAAHFEREKGKIIFSANSPEVALQSNAQDQLSIFIQIASMIAADPARFPRGTAIEMQAVGSRDADIWRFVVDGEETLNLPIGEQSTLKLTRLPNKPYDLTVEIWLAPALGFLPSRIRLTQNNGDFIDQQLRSSETPR